MSLTLAVVVAALTAPPVDLGVRRGASDRVAYVATASELLAAAKPVPTPAAASWMAWRDCQRLPEGERLYYRYFFTTDRSDEFYGAFSYVLNTSLSHSSVIRLPDRVAEGWLLRIDLRQWWPQPADFEALFKVYETLDLIEPYFHTQGELVVQEKQKKKKLVSCPPYQGYDETGALRTYSQKWSQQEETVEVVKVSSEHSLHLLGPPGEPAAILLLAAATQSKMPLCRADWLLRIISSTNPAENGRYYEFRRVEESDPGLGTDPKAKSAEQKWLESMGVNYADVQKRRTDQRVAIWRSNVTGKPRVVEYFFASAARAAAGPALITLTRDWFTGPIAARRHGIRNLLNYEFDGTEAIGPLPNGMLEFLLFDAAGNLIKVAPQTLVTDRNVPSPHPADLQPSISCIRCHYPEEMRKPCPNDILAMSKGRLGLGAFDDESDRSDDPADTLDRLLGLYAGTTEEPLRLARNGHAKVTFLATGGMSPAAVGAKIAQIYETYYYDPVTPAVAMRDLGVEPGGIAELGQLFDAVLPKLPPNRHGINPETPMIGALRAWTPQNPLFVNRYDWESEYADAMLRAATESIRRSKLSQEAKR